MQKNVEISNFKKYLNKSFRTRAKDAKSLRRNVLRILSFKKIRNRKGKNGMHKERIESKIIKTKPTLNVK